MGNGLTIEDVGDPLLTHDQEGFEAKSAPAGDTALVVGESDGAFVSPEVEPAVDGPHDALAAETAMENAAEEAAAGLATQSTFTLTVDLTGTGSGGVVSSPAGISCSGQQTSCSAAFPTGTTVTLSATPTGGYSFLGWSGACAGTGGCSVSLTGDRLVVATFHQPAAAVVTFYHLDAIGSVRARTDGSGTVLARHDYMPFGEDTQPMTGDPRRFTGKELDPETGQLSFVARQYRSSWGRFLTFDPHMDVGANMVDPQSWNRYAYVKSNPLRFVDPFGLTHECGHRRYCDTVIVEAKVPPTPFGDYDEASCLTGDEFGGITVGPVSGGCFQDPGSGPEQSGGGGSGGGGGTTQRIGAPKRRAAATQHPCVEANLIERAVLLPVLRWLARSTDMTIGVGGGGGFALQFAPPFAYAAGVSVLIVATPSGEAGRVGVVSANTVGLAPGLGIGTGGIIGPQIMVSNAADVSDLAGVAVQGSASAAHGWGGGVDVALSGSVLAATGTVGVGGGGRGAVSTFALSRALRIC
jgi:RHS repeat-associated protein